jgi:hypothetical protein
MALKNTTAQYQKVVGLQVEGFWRAVRDRAESGVVGDGV